MPRPRKYPFLADTGDYVPEGRPELFMSAKWRRFEEIPIQVRHTHITNLRKMHHRLPASYTDVLAGMQVLDVLQRANPNFKLRSRYIADEANKRSEHYWFDAINVGKIMTELVEMGENAFADDANSQPIIMETDARGNYFIVADHPHVYQWLSMVRTRAEAEAERLIEQESRGVFEGPPISAFQNVSEALP